MKRSNQYIGLSLSILFPIWLFGHTSAFATDGPEPSQLTLFLPWNQTTYKVPAPAVITDEMRNTDQYRKWRLVKDARTLVWILADHRRYEVDAMGWGTVGNHEVPLITGVRQFRPDGTLEIESSYTTHGPETWTVYAADGKTPSVKVTYRLNGLPETPFIEYVDFPQADGTTREYHANAHQIVFYEWLISKDGQPRLVHGGNQYRDATTLPTTRP